MYRDRKRGSQNLDRWTQKRDKQRPWKSWHKKSPQYEVHARHRTSSLGFSGGGACFFISEGSKIQGMNNFSQEVQGNSPPHFTRSWRQDAQAATACEMHNIRKKSMNKKETYTKALGGRRGRDFHARRQETATASLWEETGCVHIAIVEVF